ncbi:MAG TPA: carbamate kinase [Bacteroidota bacterium]
MKKTVLIAVGGNSLIRTGQRGTIAEQIENARLTAESIAEVAASGYEVVITHGNGPQVGSQLLRSEAGSSQTYQLPLDVCVAMTQGEIGFVVQNTIQAALQKRGIRRPVVTLVTQVVVDCNDPAFRNPTKPIGPFYSKSAADQKRSELGWNIIEDAARGYRRVVPSPIPRDIVELDIIRECIERDVIVITVGGGGIPVVERDGMYSGIEAVIDKDRASALLASKLGLQQFLISTDVEHVCINYKKPGQQVLGEISADVMKTYLHQGQFQEGSMKPKIEAALQFLEKGGQRVVITNPEHILPALEGKTGTIIRDHNDGHETSSHHRIATVQSAHPR